jgi:hypothetical protein
MAWEAEVIGKRIEAFNANVVATIVFRDPETGRQEQRDCGGDDLTDAGVAEFCAKIIGVLTKRDAAPTEKAPLLAAITLGGIDIASVPKPDAAAAAWFANRLLLRTLRTARDEGLIAKDHPELVAAEAANVDGFRDEYLSDTRFR